MSAIDRPSQREVAASEDQKAAKWGGLTFLGEGARWSGRSTRGVTVTVSRIPTPGISIATIEVKYGKGGRGKECWWPDVSRCYDQITQVLDHFMHDRTSLGSPIRMGRQQNNHALATWNQARKTAPGENSHVK
jgi:hypothetical protein